MYGPKVCSRCHKVSYCSAEHQSIHWTKGLHKQLCGTQPPPSPANLSELSISDNKESKDESEEEEEEEYDEDGNVIEKKKKKALTQTLTKEQQDYANKLDIDYRLVERMNRFPELEIISEAEIFDQEALEEGLADESSGDEQEAEEGWEEKAAALKLKREKKAALLAKKNGGVSKSLETAESSMNALVPVGDEVYENTKTDIDSAFLTFQKRIALYPDQVLR